MEWSALWMGGKYGGWNGMDVVGEMGCLECEDEVNATLDGVYGG